MNEILERKKQRKKQLEHDLPIIHKIQDFAKGNDKTIEEIGTEIQGKLKGKYESIEFFTEHSLRTSISRNTVTLYDEFHKRVKELDDEYNELTKQLAEKSIAKRFGLKEIFIAVASSIITIISLYLLSKVGISFS